MGKSMEDILAEARRRARERMGLPPEDDAAAKPAEDAPSGTVTAPETSAAAPKTSAAAADTIAEQSGIEREYHTGELLLGSYRVSSEAIRGGMGSVWKVYHNGWNTDLAMKRPQAKFFDSEKSKETFIHECKAWIGLGLHPNIVSCYYVREIEDVPTVFAEWMPNGSLKDHIRDGSLYSGTQEEQQERLLDIAIQFARGLHYAHERNLIHQDVKPDNLLLTDSWDAKVADFGLARACSYLTVMEGSATERELPDPESTTVAPTGGYTLAYASPEQLNSQLLTRRTDIYSWAVSVMETYLGERLWMSGNAAGEACRGYFGHCRVPMPERLQELLAQCMEREQEARPHDLRSIENALLEIYREQTGKPYGRPDDPGISNTAGSLNNYALSYLDLGRPEEAERCWDQAVIADPNDLLTLYNIVIYKLHAQRVTFNEAADMMRTAFENHFGDPLSSVLLARLWLERGNNEYNVRGYLAQAGADAPGADELLAAMEEGRTYTCPYELSRVMDLRAVGEEYGRFRERAGLIRSALAEDDLSGASEEYAILAFDPGCRSFVYSPEGLQLNEELSRRGFPVHVAATWPQLSFSSFENNVSFSPDGKRVLAGACVYERDTGRCILDDPRPDRNRDLNRILAQGYTFFFGGPTEPVGRSICSNPDREGRYFLTADTGSAEFVSVDMETGERSGAFTWHNSPLKSLRMGAFEHIAVSASEDGCVCISNLKSHSLMYRIQTGQPVKKALLNYSGSKLVLSYGETIQICSFSTGGMTNETVEVSGLKDFDISPLRDIAAVAAGERGLFLIDLSEGSDGLTLHRCYDMKQRSYGREEQGADVVRFLPDGRHLAAADGRIVYYWDILTDTLLSPVFCGTKVTDLAVSPDGKYLAVMTAAGCRIWRSCLLYRDVYPSDEWPHELDTVARLFIKRFPHYGDAEIDGILMPELADRGFGGIARETITAALCRFVPSE